MRYGLFFFIVAKAKIMWQKIGNYNWWVEANCMARRRGQGVHGRRGKRFFLNLESETE